MVYGREGNIVHVHTQALPNAKYSSFQNSELVDAIFKRGSSNDAQFRTN